MNRSQCEALYFTLKAAMAQVESALQSETPKPPPDPGHYCESCGDTNVEQIDPSPEELWRIKCKRCKRVSYKTLEPVLEEA